MKLRIIKLSPERLTQLLQGKNLSANLPSDLEILDVKMDLFAKQVSIVVRSDCFDDVAESVPIPELNLGVAPTLINEPKTSPKIAASPKPEAKIEPRASSSIAKLTTPQPDQNKWASKMENEFSPEQRKLLNFTVRGEFVVVKPVSFLKAEWEDINEVVRSLGGKWVKGDILSYWEIPLQ